MGSGGGGGIGGVGKEYWLQVEPWFVLWLFTINGQIERSSYGIEIDWDQTFVPARTRSTAESLLSRGT